MNKERNKFLYYSSIVMLVFGGIYLLSSLLIILAGRMMDSVIGSKAIFGKITLFIALINLIISVIYICVGYVGYKNSNNPENASTVFTLGLVCSIISLVAMIARGSMSSIITLAIPLCYTYGAYQMQTGKTLSEAFDEIKHNKQHKNDEK